MHKCLTPLLRDEVRLRFDRAFLRGGFGPGKEFQESGEAIQIPVPSLGCRGMKSGGSGRRRLGRLRDRCIGPHISELLLPEYIFQN